MSTTDGWYVRVYVIQEKAEKSTVYKSRVSRTIPAADSTVLLIKCGTTRATFANAVVLNKVVVVWQKK